jgi:hypothetical protein
MEWGPMLLGLALVRFRPWRPLLKFELWIRPERMPSGDLSFGTPLTSATSTPLVKNFGIR